MLGDSSINWNSDVMSDVRLLLNSLGVTVGTEHLYSRETPTEMLTGKWSKHLQLILKWSKKIKKNSVKTYTQMKLALQSNAAQERAQS